jgi:hypothetical protein
MLEACAAGRGDCDANPSNGCETDTSDDMDHCGMCNNRCTLPDAMSACSAGGCVVTGCEGDFRDCDLMAANGCETSLGTDANCGSCGDACAPGVPCTGGVCLAGCGPMCGGCNGTCGTGGSRCDCAAGCTCSYECSAPCEVRCRGLASTCTIDAEGLGNDVDLDCAMGSHCTLDARGQSNVTGTCSDVGTRCDFDCQPPDTSNCLEIDCVGGAQCRIHCGTTENCAFRTCEGGLGQLMCSGWLTCNTGTCP